MAATMRSSSAGTQRDTLPTRSGGQVKADSRPELPGTRLRDVAADALHMTTSQKAAALDIEISDGRLSSKLKDGSLTLAQLESLGPQYAVKLGEQLIETFAPLATPKARAQQQIREIRQRLEELDQVLELIA